ncbi:MAG: hypothetical protein M4579_002099 [Chaenotheca gracillima]|nr:MAG: hypothetical protein M4579_002099 [Chaenotheca gracillima]
MARRSHTYCGSYARPPLSSAGKETMVDAIRKIHALYDAGIPFYTKEKLREVSEQLEKHVERGQKVSVMGLDEVIYDFEIETGRNLGTFDTDFDFILREPILHYSGIQHLTSRRDEVAPLYAYCNIRIAHCMEPPHRSSKEILEAPLSCTREEVETNFQCVRAQWESSDARKHLKSMLCSIDFPSPVTKIVGFACASMAYDLQHACRQASAFQHALLLTLQEDIGEKQGNNSHHIRCYAQEPAYDSIDEHVLAGHNITVLDDPKGFLEVDDSTVVFSCAPNVPVKEIIADIARPAVMIWNRVCEDDPTHAKTDPNSPRVRQLARSSYKELEFPGDEEHFGDVAIYVRHTSLQSSCEA